MVEPAVVAVRYGRARLTVATAAGARDRGLTAALEAYGGGDADASDVAWAFVRARVVDHSPSFSWEQADLERLVPLVASASADPRLEATSSRELADALISWAAPKRPAPSPAPAAPRKRPNYVLRRTVALGVLAAIVAVVWLLLGGDDARQQAEAYRSQAAPAVTAIADSMDGVYGAFDVLVGGGSARALQRTARDAALTIQSRRSDLEAPDPDGDSADAVALRAAINASVAYAADCTVLLKDLAAFSLADRATIADQAPALYARTRRLAATADQLEDQVLSLAGGAGDPEGANHYRPAPPKALREGGSQ